MMAALGKAKINAYISVATAIAHAIVFYLAISKMSMIAGDVLTGGVYFASSITLWCVLVHYKNKSAEIE